MRHLVVGLPAFGFVIGTRIALAFGIGLLVANKLSETRRRAVGLALVAVGAVTTVPAAMLVARNIARSPEEGGSAARHVAGVSLDPRLIGAERFPRKGDDQE